MQFNQMPWWRTDEYSSPEAILSALALPEIWGSNGPALVPLFAKQKYMLGDEFSMLDVAIAPLLWRLEHYSLDLPKSAAPLMKYAERIFTRQGFIDALTPSERAMRR